MAMQQFQDDPNNSGGYVSNDPNFGMGQQESSVSGGSFNPQGTDGSFQWGTGNTGVAGGYGPNGYGAGAQTAGPSPQVTNPNDPAQVRAWLQWRASQPGSDPILQTPGGIDYYTTQILNNGGLTDTNYWTNKSTLAQFGGAVGAGGAGGAGGFGSLWNRLPGAADAQAMPGFQFALNKGINSLLDNKAALGLNQSGAAVKDLADYVTGDALQGYGQLAGLNLAYNQSNANNLMGLAGLGLQGVNAGSA